MDEACAGFAIDYQLSPENHQLSTCFDGITRMLLLNRHEVERLLDLDRLIEALGPAMAELSAGRVSMPARIMTHLPERGGLLAAMPVYLRRHAHPLHEAGQRVSGERGAWRTQPPSGDSGFRRGDGLAPRPDGWDVHYGGANGGGVSSVRSAVWRAKTRTSLVIIGSGVQARAHASAIPLVRPIREIRVVGRDSAKGCASGGGNRDVAGNPCQPVRGLRRRPLRTPTSFVRQRTRLNLW